MTYCCSIGGRTLHGTPPETATAHTPPETRPHQRSVSGCFQQLTAPEILEGENAYEAAPEAGGRQLRAERRCMLALFPPMLVLQLQRFQQDPCTGTVSKDNSALRIETKLDLAPFTAYSPDSAIASRLRRGGGDDGTAIEAVKSVPVEYELWAALVHSGTSSFGHYWSFVRCARKSSSTAHCTEWQWLCFNDATITEVSEAQVLATAGGGEGSSTSAYMLLYVRKDCVHAVAARPEEDRADNTEASGVIFSEAEL